MTHLHIAINIHLKHTLADKQSSTRTHAITHLHGILLHLLAHHIVTRAVVTPMVGIYHRVTLILIIFRQIDVSIALQGHTHRRVNIQGTHTLIVPIGYCRRLEVLRHQRCFIRAWRDAIINIGTHHNRVGHIGNNG